MPTFEKRTANNGDISYRAKVRVTGCPPQSATFKSKTAAKHWANRIEAEMREDKYFPSAKAKKHTVAALIDTYLEHLKGKNPQRFSDVQPMLEWWKSEVGKKTLANFRSEDVMRGQQKLLTREKPRKDPDGIRRTLSSATVNRYMGALHTAIRFGVRPLKWITVNPADGVDKLKEPPGRIRFLSENEIERLLAACRVSRNPYLFALVLIGISTGARRSEIQWMTWANVNAEATLITIPKTKNGKIRSASLTGVAGEMVKKMRACKTEEEVFLFPSPHNPNRPIDFESAWRHALTSAAIEDFRFHDLRHTCGSYLAMNGASAIEITGALGHKTLQMALPEQKQLTSSHF